MNETNDSAYITKKWLDLVEYPFYRLIQIIYTFLSVESIPLILYVQIKYIFSSIFHRNVKIILLLFYSLALLHAVAYSFSQIYAISNSMIVRFGSVHSSTYAYAFLHLCNFSANFGLTLSLLALCCERGMATVRFNKYENHGISTVLVLSGLTIFGIIVAMIYVYDMDDFNAVAFTFIILPPGAVTEYNKLAVVNIVISFLCPTILLVSSRINKKRGLIGSTTLTSRYQTRENVITTEFAARIAILQVSFCVFQGVGGVVVRVLGNYLLHDNDVLYTSIRQMFYMLPIFTFVLPIYSLCQLKYYRSNREENIRSMVIMESRGVVGSRNYEEVITKAW